MQKRQSIHRWLVIATLAAGPCAMGAESLLATMFDSPELALLREQLSGPASLVNWCLLAATGIAGVTALVLARRRLASQPAMPALRTGVFLWTSSLPQLPMLAATVGCHLGGSPLPSWGSVATASVFILLLGKLTEPPANDTETEVSRGGPTKSESA